MYFLTIVILSCASCLVANAIAAEEFHATLFVSPTGPTYPQNDYTPPAKLVIVHAGDSAPTDASLRAAARVDLVRAYNISGWDLINVTALNTTGVSDLDRYYAIGFLEGYATQLTTWFNYQVAVVDEVTGYTPGSTARFNDFIDKHFAFLTTGNFNLAMPNATRDAFHTQVGSFMLQMRGLSDGYNQKCGEIACGQSLSHKDIFLLNLQPEIGDIMTAVNATVLPSPPSLDSALDENTAWTQPSSRKKRHNKNNLHCSALIRFTGDDLFLAHTTWSGFNSMFRQYKTYFMQTDAYPVTVAYSGYPSSISSGDDWYVTSKYLAITETTIEVFNNTLYEIYTTPQTVSEFLRVMAATFLADSGAGWMAYFSTLNSGTYCNEWMVVDYKLFQPRLRHIEDQLADGLFWVCDQLPGSIEQRDLTPVLRQQGYFASYNTPYFNHVFDVSGNLAQEILYGSIDSYHKYARAEIFARDAPNIVDMAGMKLLMRANNYQTDPFSLIPNCTGAVNNTCQPPYNPTLAIASRADLSPNFNTTAEYIAAYGDEYFFYQPDPSGAIDSKIAAYSWIQQGRFGGEIIAGPTTGLNGNLPPFSWTEFGGEFASSRPLGMPDTFDFPWQSQAFPIDPLAVALPPSEAAARTAAIVVSVIGFIVIVVAIVYVVRRRPMPGATESSETTSLTKA